jgi:hypothetical protein
MKSAWVEFPYLTYPRTVYDTCGWFLARRRAMPTHRFHIGQIVFLTPSLDQNISGGAYIITKKLPERDGEPEYRVKSVNEPYERVVRESQVRLAGE